MPKRSDDKRSTAKAEYLARRSKGEKVNLRELSERVGVTYQTLRNWKSAGQGTGRAARKQEQRGQKERVGQP